MAEVDAGVLRDHPLPNLPDRSTKDGRGSVLVIGGTRETPGGVLLAGTAALRAGAGRVTLGTVASRCAQLAIAVPEARVIDLDEAADGAIAPGSVADLAARIADYDAVLVGTGAIDPDATGALVEIVLEAPRSPTTTVVLDAAAIGGVRARPQLVRRAADSTVLVPNGREMATLLDRDEATVAAHLDRALGDAIQLLGCTIALRGADTWMGTADGARFVDRTGSVGLATAGSGDVVAGLLVGLLARAAPTLPALLWSVHAHALAAARLGAHGHGTRLLARDLVDEIPSALTALGAA